MQRCLGPGRTQQQVGQGPRKMNKAKKTPASSLFLDGSLRPGPRMRGVPWGAAEGCPGRYTLTAETPAVQHTGGSTSEHLLQWNDAPRFQTAERLPERGCPGAVGWGALVPSRPPHPRSPHWGLVKLWEHRQKVAQPLRGDKSGAKLSGFKFQWPRIGKSGWGSPTSL